MGVEVARARGSWPRSRRPRRRYRRACSARRSSRTSSQWSRTAASSAASAPPAASSTSMPARLGEPAVHRVASDGRRADLPRFRDRREFGQRGDAPQEQAVGQRLARQLARAFGEPSVEERRRRLRGRPRGASRERRHAFALPGRCRATRGSRPAPRITSTKRWSLTGSTSTSTPGTEMPRSESSTSAAARSRCGPARRSMMAPAASSVQKLPRAATSDWPELEPDAGGFQYAPPDLVAQRVVAEERQVAGAAAGRDAGANGHRQPHLGALCARRSRLGMSAASSSLRSVCWRASPPSPSTTQRTIFVWRGVPGVVRVRDPRCLDLSSGGGLDVGAGGPNRSTSFAGFRRLSVRRVACNGISFGTSQTRTGLRQRELHAPPHVDHQRDIAAEVRAHAHAAEDVALDEARAGDVVRC